MANLTLNFGNRVFWQFYLDLGIISIILSDNKYEDLRSRKRRL